MKCKSRPPMRYTLTVEKLKSTGQDANNQLDKSLDASWEVYCTGRRCYVRDAGGRERFADDITVATVNKVVGMWADPKTRQIQAAYRAKYTDIDGVVHTLEVTAKKVSEDGKFVTLHCWEDAG